jgi:hypothetical protein
MKPCFCLLLLLSGLTACRTVKVPEHTICPPPPMTTPAAPASYLGLTEAEALAAAERAGRPARIVARDDQMFPVTMDYREDRLNFTITAGRVSKVGNG